MDNLLILHSVTEEGRREAKRKKVDLITLFSFFFSTTYIKDYFQDDTIRQLALEQKEKKEESKIIKKYNQALKAPPPLI